MTRPGPNELRLGARTGNVERIETYLDLRLPYRLHRAMEVDCISPQGPIGPCIHILVRHACPRRAIPTCNLRHVVESVLSGDEERLRLSSIKTTRDKSRRDHKHEMWRDVGHRTHLIAKSRPSYSRAARKIHVLLVDVTSRTKERPGGCVLDYTAKTNEGQRRDMTDEDLAKLTSRQQSTLTEESLPRQTIKSAMLPPRAFVL